MKYFMTKKVSKQKYSFVITKNSKWDILSKNLVKMVLTLKKFNIFRVH